MRTSQSIPLNIAEGNGKTADADRRRYFEIARGSALECAAVQDVLVVGKALDKTESQSRKMDLDRMAAMLSRLGGRGYQVREDRTIYGDERNDFDPDFDSDLDEGAKEPRQTLGHGLYHLFLNRSLGDCLSPGRSPCYFSTSIRSPRR